MVWSRKPPPRGTMAIPLAGAPPEPDRDAASPEPEYAMRRIVERTSRCSSASATPGVWK